MPGELDGKAALVTGGARGLGRAIAEIFVREGARVVIADVLADEGEALSASLGDRAAFTPLDVTSEEDWAAALARAADRFGGVDILVNNAGLMGTIRLRRPCPIAGNGCSR